MTPALASPVSLMNSSGGGGNISNNDDISTNVSGRDRLSRRSLSYSSQTLDSVFGGGTIASSFGVGGISIGSNSRRTLSGNTGTGGHVGLTRSLSGGVVPSMYSRCSWNDGLNSGTTSASATTTPTTTAAAATASNHSRSRSLSSNRSYGNIYSMYSNNNNNNTGSVGNGVAVFSPIIVTSAAQSETGSDSDLSSSLRLRGPMEPITEMNDYDSGIGTALKNEKDADGSGSGSGSGNPLECLHCHTLYEQPMLLECLHSFCLRDMPELLSRDAIVCPICKSRTELNSPPSLSLPPLLHTPSVDGDQDGAGDIGDDGDSNSSVGRSSSSIVVDLGTERKSWDNSRLATSELMEQLSYVLVRDQVLEGMVQASKRTNIPCENCEDSYAVFFCNTCEAALCPSCRDTTHSARLFAKHDVVAVNRRASFSHERNQLCFIHGKIAELFCMRHFTPLCIVCFMDQHSDHQPECSDIETMHCIISDRVSQGLQTVTDLSTSLSDAVTLLNRMMEEASCNADEETSTIEDMHRLLCRELDYARDNMIEAIDEQRAHKLDIFRVQKAQLLALSPKMEAAMNATQRCLDHGNQRQFLDVSKLLLNRLDLYCQHVPLELIPKESSQIQTDARSVFVQAANRVLGCDLDHSTSMFSTASPSSLSNSQTFFPFDKNNGVVTPPTQTSHHHHHHHHPRHGEGGLISSTTTVHLDSSTQTPYAGVKGDATDESVGLFVRHCVKFGAAMEALHARMEMLKNTVTDLHRDITMRKCALKDSVIVDVIDECNFLGKEIAARHQALRPLEDGLEQFWGERISGVEREQELFKSHHAQVNEIQDHFNRLQQIVQQIGNFSSAVTLTSSVVAEKSSAGMSNVFDEIKVLKPNSQQRLESIRTAREIRQTEINEMSNDLEEVLKMTKGKLRKTEPTSPSVSPYPISSNVEIKIRSDFDNSSNQDGSLSRRSLSVLPTPIEELYAESEQDSSFVRRSLSVLPSRIEEQVSTTETTPENGIAVEATDTVDGRRNSRLNSVNNASCKRSPGRRNRGSGLRRNASRSNPALNEVEAETVIVKECDRSRTPRSLPCSPRPQKRRHSRRRRKSSFSDNGIL